MKKSLACLLTLVTLLLCSSARAQNMQDQSLNYQAGPAHTGFVSSPAVAPPFKKKWTVNFGQNISYPVVADGRVFVTVRNPSSGAYGTKLYAIDAATGATLWGPVALGGTYYWSALTYENGRLFSLNYDGQMTAYEAASGAVVWTRKLGNTYSGFDSAPTAYQGVIYTGGSGGGTVYAVSAATGAILWYAPVINGNTSSPALTDDGAFVSYACAMSYRFDRLTGAQLWNFRTGCSGGGGKAPVVHDGRVYVRDASVGNHILDALTGAKLGTFNSRNTPAFSGSLGFFTPYALYDNLKLEARDLANNNALVWSFTGDGYLRSAPLVIDGHVYVGSDMGMLYALDKQTGQVAWSANVGVGIPGADEHNVSQPLTGFAAGSGLLVVPTKTTLVAFEHVEPDLVAPTLEWGAQVPAASEAGWNNTPVDIPYTTSDNAPGPVRSSAPSPLRFSADGANQTRQVTVTDESGNSNTYTSPAVNIDMTAPSTAASASGPAGGGEWYGGDAQVTLSASDGLSGVAQTFYELDGGAAQTYSAPFGVSGEGSHSVVYWSVDAAGNAEPRKTLSVGIDASGPSTQFSAAGNQGGDGWFRGPGAGPVQITLSASDSLSGAAGTFYQIDGGPAQTYAGAFAVSGEGRHQVRYWSVDRAGNAEAPQSAPVNIDATGATVQSNASGPAGNSVYFGGPVQITLTGGDNLSGVAGVFYRVDEGPTQTYSAPFTVTGDGTHPVDFWATDVAGNTSNTFSYRIMIRIDATAPATQAAASGTAGDNGWYRRPVQVSLAASDALSGVRSSYFYLDGGVTQLYGAPFTVSGDGVRTLRFWSTDQANNSEAQQSLVLRIDNGAPVITVATSPATAYKNKNPVSVTVSGRVTDAASGVAAGSTAYSVVDEYGVAQPAGAVTLKADGTYSFVLSLPATRNSKDADGHKYTITVRASDAAGNSGSALKVVTIL